MWGAGFPLVGAPVMAPEAVLTAGWEQQQPAGWAPPPPLPTGAAAAGSGGFPSLAQPPDNAWGAAARELPAELAPGSTPASPGQVEVQLPPPGEVVASALPTPVGLAEAGPSGSRQLQGEASGVLVLAAETSVLAAASVGGGSDSESSDSEATAGEA